MSLTELDGAFIGCSETGRNISFLVYNPPIPLATFSKIWFCGRLVTGIAVSNLGSMKVRLLLGFVCVVKQWSLRRTDPSSREILPYVLRLSAILPPQR